MVTNFDDHWEGVGNEAYFTLSMLKGEMTRERLFDNTETIFVKRNRFSKRVESAWKGKVWGFSFKKDDLGRDSIAFNLNLGAKVQCPPQYLSYSEGWHIDEGPIPAQAIQAEVKGKDWRVAKGTALEDIVARLLRGWDFDIQTRVRARDKSGIEHEIDVLGKKKEAFGEVTLAVECKNHVEPIDIKEIRNFNDKLSSLGYSKGLFISTGGFTPPALNYANSVGIELWDNAKLQESLEKDRFTGENIPNALPVNSGFKQRILPPLENANRLQVVDSRVHYSPYFFVTYHCFSQQWINFQLTNLESSGLAVVDAQNGEIVDLEARGGVTPHIPQTKNFASCDSLPTRDIPKDQAGEGFKETGIATSRVSESEARQKVQLEVTKNLFQTFTYQTGRGKYVRTEQKTMRPKVSEVSIQSARLLSIPIATTQFDFKGKRFERVVQGASFRILKDDFRSCTLDRNQPKSICEECGRLVCNNHARSCMVCGKMLCVTHAVSKGLIQKKVYCREHEPVKP